MKKYNVYLDGVYFFTREANGRRQAIQATKDQIENLHPLNYPEDSLEDYRNRFRNRQIEAFEVGDKTDPYKQQTRELRHNL